MSVIDKQIVLLRVIESLLRMITVPFIMPFIRVHFKVNFRLANISLQIEQCDMSVTVLRGLQVL